MTDKRIPRVAIIGGGITGLAAACHLAQLSQDKKFDLEILLFESSDKLGGTIGTFRKDDCLLETGPDALFAEKPWGIEFCRKIGAESEIVPTNPNDRSSFVFCRGQLLTIPEGFYLTAPAKIIPFVTSPILSWKGKLRALCDIFIPRKKIAGDESLALFVRRRLGQEVLDRIAQPMVGGIYAANPEELSLQSTFPRFLEMEQKYGSVIRGLRKGIKMSAESASRGPRYQLFVSFKNGMQTLIDKASAKIPEGSVRLNTEIGEIRLGVDPERKYKVCGGHFEIGADAVCLTLPAHASAKLIKPMSQPIASELEKIPYTSGMTVNLIYRKSQIKHPLNGFGFVVPSIERKMVTGVTYSSVKFPGRAPDSKVILRAFIGGKVCERLINQEDKRIIGMVKKELFDILRTAGDPMFVSVHRHKRAMPQYRVGHLGIVRRIRSRLQMYPGLELAGNGYDGVGIPDCVHSAETSAERIFNLLHVESDKNAAK